MRQSAKSVVVLALGIIVVAALVWSIVRDTATQPYSIDRARLTGWTPVTSQGAEPWVLAAQPPPALTAALVDQLSEKTGLTLVAPRNPALPLVLRGEYDDALQGVYGIDTLLRKARDIGLDSAVFEPVCIAHQSATSGARPGELFYIAFDSPVFRELRQDMLPAQPEHGGVGVYDPGALIPLLPVAATDNEFGRWWPLTFNRLTDCQAQVSIK